MCLNFEFCIYITWFQIPEWWMFVIVGIYIFHIFHIFKICMTIASRCPRWISLKFRGGLHTSRLCVSSNSHPSVPKPWGNIGFYWVISTNSDVSSDNSFRLVPMGVDMSLQSNISNILKISAAYIPWFRNIPSGISHTSILRK